MEDRDCTNIEIIKKELERLRENPADFVTDSETDRFKGYCERWFRQKKIREVWEETEILFFPLWFHDSFFSNLQQLCFEDFDSYMNVLSSIEVPYVLHDILLMQIRADNGWETLLKIFEAGDACKSRDNLFADEIDSILAPAALDVLAGHILYSMESSSAADKCAQPLSEVQQNKAEQISEILRNRTDGFYLSYHYVKYLLWKDPKKEFFFDLLETLSDGFEAEAEKQFVVDGRVIVEGLEDFSDDAVRDFKDTGVLNKAEGIDALLNFRTLLRFLQEDGQEELLWDAFKTVYSCSAGSFFTNDFDFHLKHSDICSLMLSRKDAAEAWGEISGMMHGGLHRLSFQYFEDQAANLRSHIEFMQAASLRMLDILCEEDTKSALMLWKKLWTDGLEYARRFAVYEPDYVQGYLCRLICYYYVCFVKERNSTEEEEQGRSGFGMDELKPVFQGIKNMPILVLRSAGMLLKNGLDWQDFMEGKNREFFAEIFQKAGKLAAGQVKYEKVSLFLKKMQFEPGS